nr:methyl-accepting chemotaxis protein [Bacillus mediterraneensis]
MKRVTKNLKAKLLLSFAFILIVPAIIIGILSFTTAKDALENEILAGINENVRQLDDMVNTTIEDKKYVVKWLSENIDSKSYSGEDTANLRKTLSEYSNLHPEIEGSYVGTNTGLLIQEPNTLAIPPGYDPRDREWYKAAMERRGEVIISEPYLSAGTNDLVFTISRAIKDGTGVIAVDIYMNPIQKAASKIKIGESGYAFLFSQDKGVIAHPTKKIGSKITEKELDPIFEDNSGRLRYSYDGSEKSLTYRTNKHTGWKIGGNIVLSEIDAVARPILNKTMIVIATAILIGGVLVFFIIRSIMKPIVELKQSAVKISEGDLTKDVLVHSKDEIGMLAVTFNEMQDKLRQLVKKVDAKTDHVAASAEELTASAEQTSSSTVHVAASIQEVAGSAEKQKNGLEQNARSLDEMKQGVMVIADRAQKVSELAYHTTEQAETGGQAVNNTVNQMNSIAASVSESNERIRALHENSKQVSSILEVIAGIAAQTNLLSLNAAIEAARAGEHGKGFAVVADEVRKLAEQSQQSAGKIGDIIKTIQQDTENTVEIMSKVNEDVQAGVEISHKAIERFEKILVSTKEINPQMDEISSSTQRILSGVEEVVITANELAEIAKQNSNASEEVAASSEEQLASMEEITSAANELSKMAEELKESIATFKY